MNRSLFAAIALCALAGVAMAQPPTAPAAPAAPNAQQRAAFEARRMDRLAILLDLNEGQKAQVQTILQEQRTQLAAAFQQARASGTRPTRQQMKATRDQIKADVTTKLSSVLTPTQLQKFQLLQEPQGRHRRWHGPPPGAGPAPDSAPN